jgi:hypothetical protein
MDRPMLGYFLEGLRRQSEPLGFDPKHQRGTRGRRRDGFRLREVLGPLAPAIGEQRAIEQLERGVGMNRAVPTVDELPQLGASGVALHPDFVPAGEGLYRHVFQLRRSWWLTQGRGVNCF